MSDILVSILVPVYNVEKYLAKCLDSILAQTLTKIEVLCVNDGSTDGSLRILQEYQKKDSRIIVVNKENGGLPSARNAAINVAKGEYVGFVDSDDCIKPNMYERLYQAAKKHDSEIVICGADIYPENPKASDWYYKTLSPKDKYYKTFQADLLFGKNATCPFLWRVFVKKELIDREHLRLNEKIRLGEDRAFQTQLYPKARGISVIHDKLYNYCWYRQGSMMDDYTSDKLITKVWEHAFLVEDSLKILTDESVKTKKMCLEWAIPFIYDDYIYLSAEDKAKVSKRLIHQFIQFGYYRVCNKMKTWILEQFEYMNRMLDTVPFKPELSVILVAENNVNSIMDSLLEQDMKQIEFIIINRGIQECSYAVLHKEMTNNSKIRVMNVGYKAYSQCLNYGLSMAEGKYILFTQGNGYFIENDSISSWYRYAENQQLDICRSIQIQSEDAGIFPRLKRFKDQSADLNEEFYYSPISSYLFRKDFLKNNHLVFRQCDRCAGTIMVYEAVSMACSKGNYSKCTFVRTNGNNNYWMSDKVCNEYLHGFQNAIRQAKKHDNALLYALLVDLLNGETSIRLLNSAMRIEVNKKKQIVQDRLQVKNILLLYELVSEIDAEYLEEHGMISRKSTSLILSQVMHARCAQLSR